MGVTISFRLITGRIDLQIDSEVEESFILPGMLQKKLTGPRMIGISPLQLAEHLINIMYSLDTIRSIKLTGYGELSGTEPCQVTYLYYEPTGYHTPFQCTSLGKYTAYLILQSVSRKDHYGLQAMDFPGSSHCNCRTVFYKNSGSGQIIP